MRCSVVALMGISWLGQPPAAPAVCRLAHDKLTAVAFARLKRTGDCRLAGLWRKQEAVAKTQFEPGIQPSRWPWFRYRNAVLDGDCHCVSCHADLLLWYLSRENTTQNDVLLRGTLGGQGGTLMSLVPPTFTGGDMVG